MYTYWNVFNPNISTTIGKKIKIVKNGGGGKQKHIFLGQLGNCGWSDDESKQTIFFLPCCVTGLPVDRKQ